MPYIASLSARPSSVATISPTLARIRHVIDASEVMKTNFSHMSCMTLSASTESNRAAANTSRMAWVRARGAAESRSPKVIECSGVRCSTAPSGALAALMWQRPPSTRAAPKAASSRSRCDSPFRTGSTAVRSPTAGRMAAMASSRS